MNIDFKNLINCNVLIKIDQAYKIEKHNILLYKNKILTFDSVKVNAPIINMKNYTIFPCFCDIHCHLGESIFRDISGNEWTLEKYLKYTDNINKRMSNDERNKTWEISAEYTLKQIKKQGIIGICAARSAEICEKWSIYNMAGYPIMDSDKLIAYKKGGIQAFKEYFKKNHNEMCNVGIFFHSLYKSNIESLKLAYECLENQAEHFSIHISEDIATYKKEKNIYGKEAIYVLDDYNLLNSNTILVHCGCTTKQELELIAKREATIAICPISNIFLNTSILDIKYLEQLGINWCIATDGLATGRSFSLIKQAISLKKIYPFLTYERLFEHITETPAKLYNRKHYTGRIEVGTNADFLITDSVFTDKDVVFTELFEEKLNIITLSF